VYKRFWYKKFNVFRLLFFIRFDIKATLFFRKIFLCGLRKFIVEAEMRDFVSRGFVIFCKSELVKRLADL
jgi:hypothetical protein